MIGDAAPGLTSMYGQKRRPAFPSASVVTERMLLCPDAPNWFTARTRNWKVVLAASPVIVALVVVTLRTSAPFWKMSYCWMVQLAPGDAAFQDSVTLLLVLLGDVSPVGMLGSMLQLPAGSVVTDSAPLCADALPALSRARRSEERRVGKW